MDDLAQPEDKPRFLLPDGCKDLIDALHLQQDSPGPYYLPSPSIPGALDILPLDLPDKVTLPSSLLVRELASALNLKTYQLIRALMEMNMFLSASTEIDFSMASAVCFRFGISVDKAI